MTLDQILTEPEPSADKPVEETPESEPPPDYSDVSAAEAEALECERIAGKILARMTVLREEIRELDREHREACKRPSYMPLFSKEKGMTAEQNSDIRRQRAAQEEARLAQKHKLAEDLSEHYRQLAELNRDLNVLRQNENPEAVRETLSRY